MYIQLEDKDKPGIAGLLAFRLDVAPPLLDLAEILLRGENTLSSGERELVVTVVSERKRLPLVATGARGFRRRSATGGAELVGEVCTDLDNAVMPEKLRALLRIAETMARSGTRTRRGLLHVQPKCQRPRDRGPDDPAVYAQLTKRLLATSYPVLGGLESASDERKGHCPQRTEVNGIG